MPLEDVAMKMMLTYAIVLSTAGRSTMVHSVDHHLVPKARGRYYRAQMSNEALKGVRLVKAE